MEFYFEVGVLLGQLEGVAIGVFEFMLHNHVLIQSPQLIHAEEDLEEVAYVSDLDSLKLFVERGEVHLLLFGVEDPIFNNVLVDVFKTGVKLRNLLVCKAVDIPAIEVCHIVGLAFLCQLVILLEVAHVLEHTRSVINSLYRRPVPVSQEDGSVVPDLREKLAQV